MRRAHKKLASVFPIATVYQFYMPTYSSGHWLFGFASKGLDPVKDADFKRWSEFGCKIVIIIPGYILGAFALPNYVQEELQKEDEKKQIAEALGWYPKVTLMMNDRLATIDEMISYIQHKAKIA